SLVRLVCVRFCFRVGGFVLLVAFVCGFIGGFAILVRVSRCSLVRLVCVRFCFRVGGFVLLVAFVCGFIGGFAILVRVSRCSLVRLVCVRFCFRVGGFVLLATFVCGFIGVFAFLVRLILGGGLRRILQQRTAGVFLVRTDGGEPGDIGRNGFDLVIGQTAHDILHDFRQIAVVALAAAVGMQLFGSVFAELAGYARVAGGRVAHACRAMAAGTGRHPEFGQSATVDRRALLRQFQIRHGAWLGVLLREVDGQILHVLLFQPRRLGLHDGVLTLAGLEQLELAQDVVRILAG